MSENLSQSNHTVIKGVAAGIATIGLANAFPINQIAFAPDQSKPAAADSNLSVETPTTIPVLETSVKDAISTNSLPPVIVEMPRPIIHTNETTSETAPSTTLPATTTTAKSTSTTTIPEVTETTTETSNESPIATVPPLIPIITPDTIPNVTDGSTSETTPIFEIDLPQLPSYEVTPEAAAIMKKDVVKIPNLGCSGMLVYDANGSPIGFSTNEHCYLRGNLQPRIQGTDGKIYVVFPAGVDAFTGDTLDTLKDVGTTAEFMVNENDDTTKDMAYGAFKGHSLQEVMAADKQMDSEQVSQLQKGDVMYMSGWPAMEPNNPGVLRREEFAMTILGTEQVTMTTNEVLNVVWAAVPKNKDGSICSFGASGSKGFVIKDGERVGVGNLGAFNDLVGGYYNNPEQAAATKDYYEFRFQVNLDGMAGVCGFVYELPNVPETVVTSKFMIPGFEQEDPSKIWDKMLTKSRTEFFDPNYTRTVVDGVIALNLEGGKGATPVFVDRPVIFHDNETGQTLVATKATKSEDNLALIPYANILNIDVYDRDEIDGVGMLSSTGAVTLTMDDLGLPKGFTDPNGLLISSTTNFDLADKQLYRLAVDPDGNLKTVLASSVSK